jgi:hypothetical protein
MVCGRRCRLKLLVFGRDFGTVLSVRHCRFEKDDDAEMTLNRGP